jgi:hypothetical protein
VIADTPPVRATIGADDLELFKEPLPALLADISGIQPEPAGLHVLLDSHGISSTQRLSLSGYGGGVVAGLWPGELKVQAAYLYGRGFGAKIVSAALKRGWTAEGSPHLAFRNSAPSHRLYMRPDIDAHEYARRWETSDLAEVGAHSRDDVMRTLWPWLKQRGYADADDDLTLAGWLDVQLGNRPALLRPGLRLKGYWDAKTVATLGGQRALREVIRVDVNAILAGASEPPLPAAIAGDSQPIS